jgi:hypothetical protein
MRGVLRRTAGWALLVVGGLLLVLPGPGIPLVLGGLALLAPDSAWAREVQAWMAAKLSRLRRPG